MNSDTNRTFNNTISSIARSGTTFTITLATALPTISTHNLSLSIVAVKNGDFVAETVNISNISGNTITFEQSGATGANIYAFPAGSSITLYGSVVGNGVTYGANEENKEWASVPAITRVEDYDNIIICEPTGATASIENDGEAITIHYQDYYADAADNNALDLNFNVVNENIPTLQINGITYSFTQSELNKIWSGKIKDWPV